MAKTAQLNVRLEQNLKDAAEAVFKQLGITSSEAINMFLSQVVLRKGLPFEVSIPDIEDLSETDQEFIRAGIASIQEHPKLGELLAK